MQDHTLGIPPREMQVGTTGLNSILSILGYDLWQSKLFSVYFM